MTTVRRLNSTILTGRLPCKLSCFL